MEVEAPAPDQTQARAAAKVPHEHVQRISVNDDARVLVIIGGLGREHPLALPIVGIRPPPHRPPLIPPIDRVALPKPAVRGLDPWQVDHPIQSPNGPPLLLAVVRDCPHGGASLHDASQCHNSGLILLPGIVRHRGGPAGGTSRVRGLAVRVLYVARTRTVPAVAGAVAKVSATAIELGTGAGVAGGGGGVGVGVGGGGGAPPHPSEGPSSPRPMPMV